MATFAFLLLGVVASLRIPTSLMPDIAIPEITIQISYENNTARELETNIVRTLRNQLLQVANLKDIETETRDGFANLKLIFQYGTNTDLAFIETNEKVDASLNSLPRNLERPRVVKASATDVPIMQLALTLKDNYSAERFLELSEFAEAVIKKRIEQLPDIALADMSGQTSPEILVSPNKAMIQSLGITNQELISAIKQNNFELGNLLVQDGIYQYNFKFSNPLKSKKDIEDIYLNIHDKLFKLKELASVTYLPVQDKGSVFFNGKRAITLAIIKQADARVYDLKAALEQLVTSLNSDYESINFEVHQDQTKLLKLSIDNLKTSLWIGSVLAILIMFFFLKDVKSPLIIAISIPVSLIVSILMMYWFDLSINIISLSGLILGVGMMIDNAIIVIDNITQKLEEGSNLLHACVEGTNEIITPLISSVLTTCSVFLPLLFLSGITGALFYDQAVAVSIGLGASLVVSIVLIPVIYKQLKNRTFAFEKRLNINVKTQHIENWYEKGYALFFGKKWIVYGISLLSIVVAVLLMSTMKYSQLPHLNQNETVLQLDWNEDINVAENQNRISDLLADLPTLTQRFSQAGEQQFLLQRETTKNFAEAEVYLKTTSPAELAEIKATIAERLKQFPQSSHSFNAPKTIFESLFGDTQAELIAQVSAKGSSEVPTEDQLPAIKAIFGNQELEEIPLKQTASIEIIHENVLLYEVSYTALVEELKTTFNQHFIDDLKTNQKFIPIKLNYDEQSFDQLISELFVRNANKEYIPVKNLIKVHNIQQYKSIHANRSGEYLTYNLQTDDNADEVAATVRNKFKNNADFNVRFDGKWVDLQGLGGELGIVIGVSLLLLYFIMAAQFESLWQPIIILLEIPIDIGGALFLLWLFGGTINIMAVIGIVVMSGVIINDSILKLHTINLLRKKGLPLEEAIKAGGKLRLKPIIMTSLTTILALTPFLFMSGLGAELQLPLALTVIGGMLIGTFISLYFIPLLYYTFSKKKISK